MQPELLALIVLNVVVILVALVAGVVLFWGRHSARHREISERQLHMRRMGPEPAAPQAVEHVEHTHTLQKVSEHEENGHPIAVKKCTHCQQIFRERMD